MNKLKGISENFGSIKGRYDHRVPRKHILNASNYKTIKQYHALTQKGCLSRQGHFSKHEHDETK